MTLRNVLLALSAAVLALALIQIALGKDGTWPILAVYSAVVLVALLVERRRYAPSVNRGEDWRFTGERFTDPTSGKLIDVFENPATGKRDYRRTDQ